MSAQEKVPLASSGLQHSGHLPFPWSDDDSSSEGSITNGVKRFVKVSRRSAVFSREVGSLCSVQSAAD
jgi:hypothetical protein